MIPKKILHYTLIINLVILPSCTKRPYYSLNHHKKLPELTTKNTQAEQEHENITIRVKKYSPKDAKTVFGDYGKRLFEKPELYPIHIAIDNQSDHTWFIAPNSVTLPCVPNSSIKKKMKNNTYARVFSIYFGGSLAATILLNSALMATASCSPSLPLVGPLALSSAFLAIATPFISHTKAVHYTEDNTAIGYDIARYTLTKKIRIYPHQRVNKLIFVKAENYIPDFTVTLINHDNTMNTFTFNMSN